MSVLWVCDGTGNSDVPRAWAKFMFGLLSKRCFLSDGTIQSLLHASVSISNMNHRQRKPPKFKAGGVGCLLPSGTLQRFPQLGPLLA